MARPHDRDQLVQQLPVAHRRPVVVLGAQQQRQHVVAVGCFGPTGSDLLRDELLQGSTAALEPHPWAEPPEIAPQPRDLHDQVRAVGELLHQLQGALEARLLLDAEDRAQDHGKGYALRVGAHGERLAHRPALHVVLGDLPDQLAVAPHALPVKRRQQQLALAKVLILVEGQDRVRPNRWLEHRGVGLAGMELGRVTGEHLPHELGAGQVDDPAEQRERDREHVAVAPLEANEETDWIARVAPALDECGKAGAGRRGSGGHPTPLTVGRDGPSSQQSWSASPRRQSRRSSRSRHRLAWLAAIVTVFTSLGSASQGIGRAGGEGGHG